MSTKILAAGGNVDETDRALAGEAVCDKCDGPNDRHPGRIPPEQSQLRRAWRPAMDDALKDGVAASDPSASRLVR